MELTDLIELKKAHLGKNGDVEVRVGEGWISNGCWMIRKQWVLNANLFENEGVCLSAFPFLRDSVGGYAELDNESINRVIPKPCDWKKAYEWTPWIYEEGKLKFRVFKALNANNGQAKHIFFNDNFVKGFNITHLTGSGKVEAPYLVIENTNNDPIVKLVIMPVKMEVDFADA